MPNICLISGCCLHPNTQNGLLLFMFYWLEKFQIRNTFPRVISSIISAVIILLKWPISVRHIPHKLDVTCSQTSVACLTPPDTLLTVYIQLKQHSLRITLDNGIMKTTSQKNYIHRNVKCSGAETLCTVVPNLLFEENREEWAALQPFISVLLRQT